MHDHLHLIGRHVEQPARFDDLEPLVHQGGRVDRDLGPHFPRRVLERVLHGHAREPRLRRLTERPPGRGEKDPVNIGSPVAGQALEHGAVLGIDGEELHAPGPRGRRHQAAGHHERLLVGERHRPAGLDRRHGREQSDASDQRRDDDVRFDVAAQRHQPVGAGEELRSWRRKELCQPVAGLHLQERDGAGRIFLAQVRDPLHVRPACCQARHRELLGEARHEVECAEPDGSGRTEQRDTFHPRHQVYSE